MNAENFENILEAQIERIRDILVVKAAEYATDEDRLANFKMAAHLRACSVPEAVGGMMVKHTVSVYSMLESKDKYFQMEVWDEKITDHINYLILLRAALAEEREPVLTPEEFKPQVTAPTGVFQEKQEKRAT